MSVAQRINDTGHSTKFKIHILARKKNNWKHAKRMFLLSHLFFN